MDSDAPVTQEPAAAEAQLPTIDRLASASAAEEADVWTAIEAFAAADRWSVVLDLIERHEFNLDPWRMTPVRVKALIELDWRRRALEQLVEGYRAGYVRGDEAVELLAGSGALALAARFIDSYMAEDLWREEARTSVTAAAARICAAASPDEAPLQYADAIQAREILVSGPEETAGAMDRVLKGLVARAGERLASDDPDAATRLFSAAARLAPCDRSLLDSLADSARRAGLTDRRLDTLLRIWTTHRDPSALLEAARGVLASSSWTTIFDVMSIAAAEAEALGLDLGSLAESYGERACHKIDQYIREGDVASGLDLLISVSGQFSVIEWPQALLTRLLRATKRRLCSQPDGQALATVLGGPYLMLSPMDADICRMVARVRVRQRRFGEALALLERVITIRPYVAGDWVALALVQNEVGDLEGRDLSVVRALIVAPDEHLPPALASVRERIGLT